MRKQVIPSGYYCWVKMRNRCNNPRNDDFQYYGARGVKVCGRWEEFAAFIADMGPRPSPKHSIDRIDPNGDYEPSNCRWATTAEQNRNKRSVRKFHVGGQVMLTKDLAALLGVDRSYIGKLSRNGLGVREIFARFGY